LDGRGRESEREIIEGRKKVFNQGCQSAFYNCLPEIKQFGLFE